MPYLIALLVGVAGAGLLPWSMVMGGGWWLAPAQDVAQSLIGHLAFQLDSWRFPWLSIGTLMPPGGINTLMLDGNPALSLLARLLPGGPHNLLGGWLFGCFLLQPVAAVYALRGLGERRLVPALVVAGLAALTPSLWFRPFHPTLCGHFIILLALGATLRLLRGGPGWRMAAVSLLLGAFVHPYLLVMAAALLCAVPLGRRSWRSLATLGSILAGVAALMALAGFFGAGAGDRGFGRFSMNLLSPVVPQLSGLFGGPVLDATGGQYEGFNYLGAGVLVLLALAWHRPGREIRPLLAVLAGLTVLALSSRIYAGPALLLDLGLKPWEDVFGPVRASGRLFWPVGYAALVLAVAALARRLPPAGFAVLGLLAVALQWQDTGPLRARAQAMLEHPAAAPPPAAFASAVAGASRLTILPAPPCVSGEARDLAQGLTLVAVRARVPVASVAAARMPPGFGCESAASDAVETPLRPGEVLLVLEPEFVARLDARLLGPVGCVGQGPALCGAGLGAPLAASAPPPMPARGETLAGEALRPFQAHGWAGDWNAGPRSTLLVPAEGSNPPPPADGRTPGPPPAASRSLSLTLRGVALNPGGTRRIAVTVNGTAQEAVLPDQADTTLVLPLPPGPVRIVFDVPRPLDPQRRGLGPIAHRVGFALISARFE